ncbi:MAG: hypothetical protein RLZZ161_1254 [Bacteroidota bacterium]|jgi:hypothetical protein
MKTFLSTIVSLIKIVLKAKRYKQPEVDNSEDCYVLGNGPSLSKLLERTPDFFDKKHVCVVNGFAATDVYQKIQPKSYFIKDGLFFWIDEGEFNDPENTWREKKSSGEKNGVIMVANTIKAMKEKTRWPMYLYVPVWAKDSILVREISQNSHIKLVYFNNIKVDGYRWFLYKFVFPRGLGNPQFMNVVQMALFQKINEGFSKIFISGVNANFHQYLEVGDDNLVYMVHHHFYDKAHAKTIISDRDKFGNYVAQPLWKQFDNLKKLFYGFSQVKLYADYKNCKIINTSKESFIDAFERDYTIE